MMMQPLQPQQPQLKNAFEVLVSEQYIVLKRGVSSLWFSRSPPTPTNAPVNLSAAFSPKAAPVPEFRLLKEGDPSTKTLFADFTCHGLAYGLIGLFLADKLLLIRAAASVGRLPFATKDEVFKVAKICVVGLCSRGEMVGDLGLDKCTQDSCTKPVLLIPSPNEPFALSASFSKLQQQDSLDQHFGDTSSASLNLQPPAFQSTSLAAAAAGGAGAVQKTWNQIKQTASKAGRVGSAGTDRGSSSASAAAGASSATGNSDPNGNNSGRQEERDKFERRFIDELYKMFNETNSFYFSWTGDLTQSVQRQQKQRAHFAKTQSQNSSNKDIRAAVPLWKRVDDRFFWNRYMLKSVVEAFETSSSSAAAAAAAQQVTPTNDKPESPEVPTTTTTTTTSSEEDLLRTYSHLWVLPIIQGFVQIEKCYFDLAETSPVGGVAASSEAFGGDGNSNPQQPKTSVVINSNGGQPPSSNFLELGRDYYLMTLISRRSRFRAGTRYKRRGLDEEGRCANYVETEQIFSYGTHTVAFVLVRGSVPLFWSQVGSKYRPPPRLERTEAENQTAFRRHFEHEFAIYEGDSVVVSLIEQTGREKILGDAFLEHVIRMDDARLAYVAFDFHDYCRGMRFENVSLLIDRIYEFIKDIRYCWVDEDGMICEQRGVFRINCIDCLDRTNIVMTAIAKAVMDIQLVRLGLLPPEGQLPANSRRIFQLMWAHNGDTISRQYAGTAALKGDYTRTGERKISGVVRDGVNSANRYYLNRFKDAYRQAVIDIMQGQAVAEALSSPENEKGSSSSSSFLSAVSGGVLSKSGSSSSISGMANSTSTTSASLSVNDPEYHERIKLVIEDCKKILVPQEEVILGGWPLVDADPVTGTPLSSVMTRNATSELPESEMDTVLILTKDCYYVADYDDQTDRVVKYQKVALEDLEKIELGAEPNYSSSGGPFSRGSSSSSSSRGTPLVSYALRLHYSIAEQTGYYHVFRSTGTRFFNNMAIPIRTREEALESLKAIAESFKVALSVKQCNVPFHELSRLEKRKSRRLYGSTGSGSGSSSEPTSAVGGRFRNVIGGGGGGVGGVGIPEASSGGASRKLLTGMYSSFSRVLRGKIGAGAGLQLDGLAVTGGGNKSSSEDHEQQQQQQVQIKVGGNFGGQNPPSEGEGMMIEEEEEEEDGDEVDIEENECSEDESCASSASESTASNILLKSGNRNRNSKNRPNTASSSSSLVVELPTSTRGSALSCSSELLLSESELDLGCASCSELMLPPISELGSPVDDQDLIDGGRLYGLGGGREHMDRVLESCGILVTSPPLIRVGGNSREATPTEHYHRAHSSRSPSPPGNYSSSATAAKGVFADVDDFVLDSMKKASLRQLHRKAVSSVSLSGGGGGGPNNGGNKSPKVSTEKQQKVPASSSSTSSDRSRCIFSSELALNSIVSQSIKRDISYDDQVGPKGGGLKSLSSSLSTDAINGGGTNTSSASNNQQMKAALLLNSSLSYAGDLSKQEKYEQQREFDQIKSFTDTMRNFIAAAEDHELNRANLDSAMLLASAGAMSHGSGSKESSLSVSDLAVLGSSGGGGGGGGSSVSSGSGVSGAGGGGLSGGGGGGGLKTSLSSTTLLNSGPMSLNLPNFHPHNSNSLHLNSCASSISISGMGGSDDDDDHHRNLNIPSIVGGGGSASSSGASAAASAASSSFTSSFMVKKDLVLSPLTRIAQKGMQSLGLNLRSSNATGGGGGEVVVDPELAKRKQQTRSRIIEI